MWWGGVMDREGWVLWETRESKERIFVYGDRRDIF